MKSVISQVKQLIPLAILGFASLIESNENTVVNQTQPSSFIEYDISVKQSDYLNFKRDISNPRESFSGLSLFLKGNNLKININLDNLKPSSFLSESDEHDIIEIDLLDYFDVQIFSTIYVGSQRQPFNLIFDTGSAVIQPHILINQQWIWVNSQGCYQCPTLNRFLYQNSKTYKNFKDNIVEVTYGTGSMKGYKGSDTICLTKDKCAENVSFLRAQQTTGLMGLKADGILGLSPTNQGSDAEMLLDELFDQGMIHNRLFSLFLVSGNGESKITIGNYDLQKFARSEISWHPLSSLNYWTLTLKSAYFGDEKLKPTVKNIIVDSGTSFLLVPTEDYLEIKQKFWDKDFSCKNEYMYNNLFTCQCSDEQYETDFKDIKVQIEGVQYVISKQNYIIKIGNSCIFKIMSLDFGSYARFWILGITFFHNYYTVFDIDNKRIGFAESSASQVYNSIIKVDDLNKALVQQPESALLLKQEMFDQAQPSENFTFILIILFSILFLYLSIMFILFMKGKIGNNLNQGNEVNMQLLAQQNAEPKLNSSNTTSSKWKQYFHESYARIQGKSLIQM
ncbi:eukaryotic aspartyl protease family protein [Stylonychia lemnae]|uniref:Eukaryotic aspartyl protease family protein n=1 Tax=Stylonychia lemnae TaxID=5949 RepID=A0A078BAG5_STYLE|nr:eukaryotic aspartyl protease family protein [Stylonychia lemnae]|eukprot:CDW90538.1 eukaryotic aspartyl protease family protein [Stylonychia lemnae]